MNIADRIQKSRKISGISQEELSEKIGVSRQAVSKWESGQSSPDLEHIIKISEFFGVSTDYILKGSDFISCEPKKDMSFTSKILYIASTTFVAIGLFCAFAVWYEAQTMVSIWGSMIIQSVGIALYFVGRILSREKPSFYISYINILGILFMPLSMITGKISQVLFRTGSVAPYPNSIVHSLIVFITFAIFAVICYNILKNKNNS